MAGNVLQTQADVFRLAAPKSGELMYSDQGKGRERAPGLTLRVRQSGSRTWVFCYRWAKLPRRVTIGDAGAWPLEKARAKARALHVGLDNGKNPADERKAERDAQSSKPTRFSAVMQDYLEARRPHMKARSHAESERHLTQHWKDLHKLDLSAVDRKTVASLLRKLVEARGPVSANRARSTLSALFAWAIGEGLCDVNPVTGTNKAEENEERERVLTDDELAAVWSAAPENDYGRIVRLLMLTGCRREEIGSLEWSEIDTDAETITLPAPRTKNAREHVVPLSEPALAVLADCPRKTGRRLVFGEGQGGYSGWSTSKEVLDAVTKLKKPWTLHDLRRTVRTGLGGLGVLPHVSEAVLNHLPPKLVRTYDKNKYEAEKRAALDLWAGHVKIALAKAGGANVHRLPTRA